MHSRAIYEHMLYFINGNKSNYIIRTFQQKKKTRIRNYDNVYALCKIAFKLQRFDVYYNNNGDRLYSERNLTNFLKSHIYYGDNARNKFTYIYIYKRISISHNIILTRLIPTRACVYERGRTEMMKKIVPFVFRRAAFPTR